MRRDNTHIFIVVKSIEDIIWKTREQVNDEPRLEIVDSDDCRVTDNLATRSNIRCVEVEDDVNEEYHIYNGVHHKQTHVFRSFVL